MLSPGSTQEPQTLGRGLWRVVIKFQRAWRVVRGTARLSARCEGCAERSIRHHPSESWGLKRGRYNHETPAFAGATELFYRLLDHAEDRVVAIVLGPDAHGIAFLEERRRRRACLDRFDGANLGKARIAHPAI